MRAPWPGLALSVMAMRSAISAGEAMPFAASSPRTATSSFSPSASRMFICVFGQPPDPPLSPPDLIRPSGRLQPMFVDFHQQLVAGAAFVPDRRLVEAHMIERPHRRRAGEGEILRIGKRTQLPHHRALLAAQVVRG